MYGKEYIPPDTLSKKVCPCTFTYLNEEGVYVTKKLVDEIKIFEMDPDFYK